MKHSYFINIRKAIGSCFKDKSSNFPLQKTSKYAFAPRRKKPYGFHIEKLEARKKNHAVSDSTDNFFRKLVILHKRSTE